MTDSQRHEPARIRDPKVMRAMAHPARLAILDYLRDGREATATECARVSGLSPSATSYHLRELAKAGLLQEAPTRGDGRERLWCRRDQSFQVELELDEPAEVHDAANALIDVLMARDNEQARVWFARAAGEPKEWFDAATFMRSQLVVTAAELSDLVRAVTELIEPFTLSHRARSAPPGARRVAWVLRAIPTAEERPAT